MYHYHHMHRCGRSVSRLFWFIAGGATATWWHVHKDYHGWYEARHCGRDRIPQNAYPAPGTPPPASPPAQMDPNVPANPPVPGTMDKWERWGWGHWGRGAWPGQENANAGANPNDRWGWNFRHGGPGAPARPEGAWGPPMPSPHPQEPEKDVMQQAQETVSREHSHPTPPHPRREFVPCPRGACSFRD